MKTLTFVDNRLPNIQENAVNLKSAAHIEMHGIVSVVFSFLLCVTAVCCVCYATVYNSRFSNVYCGL